LSDKGKQSVNLELEVKKLQKELKNLAEVVNALVLAFHDHTHVYNTIRPGEHRTSPPNVRFVQASVKRRR